MNFSSPEILMGILGASIPLLIHLLFRKKPKHVPLPTLRFILKANQKVLRRHRLRQRLLLLARMLLIGLATIAMARPFIPQQNSGETSDISGDLVIVVDNSYFMSAKTPDGSLMEITRRLGTEAIQSSRARISVVLTSPPKDQDSSLPLSADKNRAAEFISSIEVSRQLGDLSSAISRGSQVFETKTETDINTMVVLSTANRLAQMTPIDDGRIKVIPISVLPKKTLTNLSLIGLTVEPSPNIGRDTWRVVVEAICFGDGDRSTELTLRVGDELELKAPIDLTPGEGVRKTFQFSYAVGKPTRGSIFLPEDALEADNQLDFWLTPTQSTSILAINGGFSPQPQEDELFYLGRVLSDETTRQDTFDVKIVPVEAWSQDQWDDPNVVVLSNVKDIPSSILEKLNTFVAKGGGLLITLGDQVEHEILNRQLGGLLPRKLRGFRLAGDAAASAKGRDRRPARINNFDASNSVFAQIPAPNQTSISKTLVNNYALFNTSADNPIKELMLLDDGAPLLLSARRGQGLVMLLATTIDRDWTDLPIQPDFLPFIHGVIRTLGRHRMDPIRVFGNGIPFEVPNISSITENYQLKTPDGEMILLDSPETNDTRILFDGLFVPGHYVLDSPNQKSAKPIHFSVLPNTGGSDLRPTSFTNEATSPSTTNLSGDGLTTNIWSYVLFFLFILVALESRLAYGQIKRVNTTGS